MPCTYSFEVRGAPLVKESKGVVMMAMAMVMAMAMATVVVAMG
jgi:hypothetical protein